MSIYKIDEVIPVMLEIIHMLKVAVGSFALPSRLVSVVVVSIC